jgi:alpha-ribazole phosphatase/probable phosphoglycerate mutase
MATTVYIIRHGETEGSGQKRYKGTIDVPMSQRGVEQMHNTAGFVRRLLDGAGQTMSAVYCSDLVRAQKSAELVAGPLGLRPEVVERIRERDFGLWEGMSFDEIQDEYPGEFRAWARDPMRFSPMGGESTVDVKERVIGALGQMLDRHREETFCVVAHGGVNRVMLSHYLGMPLSNIFGMEQDFACVNIVEFHDGYPVMKLLNGRARENV